MSTHRNDNNEPAWLITLTCIAIAIVSVSVGAMLTWLAEHWRRSAIDQLIRPPRRLPARSRNAPCLRNASQQQMAAFGMSTDASETGLENLIVADMTHGLKVDYR